MTLNMLGAYGEWAAQATPDPPRLSFRQPMFGDIEAWRPVARARFREALLGPGGAATPIAAVQHQLEFDGLSIEHLQWQLPYGPPTEALLLKPAGARGKQPAVIALHDHGGNKYFGLPKTYANVEGSSSGDGSAPGTLLRRFTLGERIGSTRLRRSGA